MFRWLAAEEEGDYAGEVATQIGVPTETIVAEDHVTRAPDLNPNTIRTRARKNVRKRDLAGDWHFVRPNDVGDESPSTLRSGIAAVTHREHLLSRERNRAGGMKMNEH